MKNQKSNKKEKMKRLSKSKVRTQIVYLEELEKLSVEKQAKYFEEIFDKIYSGEEIESLRKYSLRCIKLTCDPKDNRIHLPYGVMVQKKGNKLIIKVYNNRTWFLLLLFLTIMFLAILGASYSAVNFSIVKNLNKDIDGDGIPELNLDLNADREAEVNIDTNWDDKPDLNIDYRGNRTPVFNVDKNKDGLPDHNLMNQDINGDGKCDLNCDLNKDGWPDINLNFNGNKRPEINIDTDNDNVPDLNFDMNSDTKCDLHCDINNDLKCDKWCLTNADLENMDPVSNGSSTNIGNKEMTIKSGELILEYDDTNEVFIDNIFPDDQPLLPGDKLPVIPTKKFKVTNKSQLFIKYNLRWVIKLNDYESDNFKFKVASTNNGANFDFVTAPKVTSPLATEIIIAPGVTQEYEIDFKLQGTGGKQNYDQGKTFSGYIEIYLNNEY